MQNELTFACLRHVTRSHSRSPPQQIQLDSLGDSGVSSLQAAQDAILNDMMGERAEWDTKHRL